MAGADVERRADVADEGAEQAAIHGSGAGAPSSSSAGGAGGAGSGAGVAVEARPAESGGHTGVGGGAEHGLLRACCYVCMTPAAWASPQVLRQRQLGYEYNLTTSHWPHEWLAVGGPADHLPRNDPSRLDSEQRLLVGYDRCGPEAWHVVGTGL